MENYYSRQEIRVMFQVYGPDENFHIDEIRFNNFCLAIKNLPKDIIDKVHKEVYFLLTKAVGGWQLSLESPLLKEKKGLIYICPHVLEDDFEPFRQKETVLHEVAHYILGHKDPKDRQEHRVFEDAENKQVEEWFGLQFSRNDRKGQS